MATYTPPPYFPQGSLAPPNKNRYRKFKVVMALAGLGLLLLLAGAGIGVWYLVKSLF
jgi:cell division septal protein FtsQ